MKNSQITKEDKSFKISCWAIALSLIAIILFFWVIYILHDLYQAKNLLPVELKLKADEIITVAKIKEITDSISYANQVGRLDLVSLLLAFLGIIIGFAAIFGFLHIKETSEAIAVRVAKETAENYLKREEVRELKEEASSAKKMSQLQKTKNKTKTSSEFAGASKHEN